VSGGELPSGTVTFLFTDIEGSTGLLKQLGDRYGELLREQQRILREAAASYDGREVDTQGDSFFFAFPRANAALAAAVAAQRNLAAVEWPDGAAVRVRMGLHTGEPAVGDERYVGLGVHRAARIGAVGHGGQVLLSNPTRELVEEEREGTRVRELGLFKLKDIDQPERLFQLDIDGLQTDFPPIRAEKVGETRPWRRHRFLGALAAVVIVALAVAVTLALTTRSGSVKLGPTSVAVIDPASNKVVLAIDLGFKSNLIAAGEGSIWVVDPQGSTLVEIDPRARTITSRIGIAVGTGAVPFGLAAGEGAVWVAVRRGNRSVVLELGPAVGNLRRVVQYGGTTRAPIIPSRFQPLAVGAGVVWAIDPSEGGIWRIPPRAGRARRMNDGLDALALAANGGGVWLAGLTGVTKLDPSTGQELGMATSTAQTFAETASVALGGNAAWFAPSSGRTLSEVDSQSVATTQTFTVGAGPSGIAVGQGAVWVANSRDGTVSRIDPRGGQARTIPLGEPPGGVVAAYGAVWTSPGEPRS
jgi:class 3 adenylate cyclase/DNA-binding beta-propeller fold protein YncE